MNACVRFLSYLCFRTKWGKLLILEKHARFELPVSPWASLDDADNSKLHVLQFFKYLQILFDQVDMLMPLLTDFLYLNTTWFINVMYTAFVSFIFLLSVVKKPPSCSKQAINRVTVRWSDPQGYWTLHWACYGSERKFTNS